MSYIDIFTVVRDAAVVIPPGYIIDVIASRKSEISGRTAAPRGILPFGFCRQTVAVSPADHFDIIPFCLVFPFIVCRSFPPCIGVGAAAEAVNRVETFPYTKFIAEYHSVVPAYMLYREILPAVLTFIFGVGIIMTGLLTGNCKVLALGHFLFSQGKVPERYAMGGVLVVLAALPCGAAHVKSAAGYVNHFDNRQDRFNRNT